MGNRLPQSQPYIIDEASSDDEINYDTAPETEMQSFEEDEEEENDVENAPEREASTYLTKESSQVEPEENMQNLLVDANMMSRLIGQVEELLSHLSNQDYQAAHSAAMFLQSCGIGGGRGNFLYFFLASLCLFECSIPKNVSKAHHFSKIILLLNKTFKVRAIQFRESIILQIHVWVYDLSVNHTSLSRWKCLILCIIPFISELSRKCSLVRGSN